MLVPTDPPGAPAPRPHIWKGGGSAPAALSAKADGQAVPCVRVLFPPPARAVILVVSPVADRGPHTPTAHGAVAASLAVAVTVGPFHGQLHAAVLLMTKRTNRLEAERREPDRTEAQEPNSHRYLLSPAWKCGRRARRKARKG